MPTYEARLTALWNEARKYDENIVHVHNGDLYKLRARVLDVSEEIDYDSTNLSPRREQKLDERCDAILASIDATLQKYQRAETTARIVTHGLITQASGLTY